MERRAVVSHVSFRTDFFKGFQMTENNHRTARDVVTEALVRQLADVAALPLAQARVTAVTAILGAWLPEANALSEKMSAPKYMGLVPVTVFTHPRALEEEV
jgi:hypothetical protein